LLITQYRQIDDEFIYSVIDRLSTIAVYSTPQLATQLVFKGRPINGSQAERSCFVERLDTGVAGLHQWNIYIHDTVSIKTRFYPSFL